MKRMNRLDLLSFKFSSSFDSILGVGRGGTGQSSFSSDGMASNNSVIFMVRMEDN